MGHPRGGLGISRQIRTLDDNTFFFATTEGTHIPAQGQNGGQSGGFGTVILDKDLPGQRILPANQPGRQLAAGQRMRVETPGGGGFGPSHLRSIEALAEDLMSDKLTRAAAERDYGIEHVQLAIKLLPAWVSA